MRARLVVHHLLSLLVSLSLLLTSVAPVSAAVIPPLPAGEGPGMRAVAPQRPAPTGDFALYRTHITIENPARRARLDALGVAVLEEGDGWAVVLADDEQLETLARLRYQPQASDEFVSLVEANTAENSWLAAAVEPLLVVGRTVSATGDSRTTSRTDGTTYEARASLRATARALTPEQRTALADLTSLDDDADELTNAQEAWWCTDPLVADTDGDGRTDGTEIQTLRDWLGNRLAGPPNETPWPDWPPQRQGCEDKDHDSIPNLAERWDLGLSMDLESTDRDRFDDGQELFGTTYCPGSGNACGYGTLPSANHDGILLFPQMPSWVTAPGNHPLVAGLPKLEFNIVKDATGADFKIQTATVVTTDERHEEGETKSYSTTKTNGTSTANADTETWDSWQEYSKTTEASEGVSRSASGDKIQINSTQQILQTNDIRTTNVTQNLTQINNLVKSTPQGYLATKGVQTADFVLDEACAEVQCKKVVGSGVRATVRTFLDIFQGGDKLQNTFKGNGCDLTALDLKNITCRLKSTGTLWKANYDERIEAATVAEQEERGQLGGQVLSGDGSSYLDVSKLYPMSYPVPASFVPTETNTQGSSRGGAHTTTHTTYEENSVTEGTAKQFGKSWGTATAVDSVHAADLWFAFEIRNIGTDYARQICDLAINIFIGEDAVPSATYYPGTDLGGDGCFNNFRPGESHKFTFASNSRIALTLEQLKTIDLGGSVRFVIEDYSLGQDDFYADDAIGAGLILSIDDGLEDGEDGIETYVTAMFSGDTVLDVLGHYFPHETNGDGSITAIWTPEYGRSDTPAWCAEPNVVGIGGQRTLWCKHALSTADWWNVYTNGLGDGSEGFQDTLASAGAVALFRFNSDTDLDGYSDRSEERLGTDPNDASDFPRPELLAGLHSLRSGNYVTATLSLLNTGLYDAYGVEAVLIAPDDSVSITNNTVGGSGRVRAQKQVIVGSRILMQTPLPTAWTQAGHAVPAPGGYYTGGEDRTYTFGVVCGDAGGCSVASGAWSVYWSDSKGITGTLNYGAGYASPTFRPVGILGLTLALRSGTVANGESFTVDARTPRDTFQYQIAADRENDYTEPLVIVSYNDPQGNHRFILPPSAADLDTPSDNLAAFSGQMLDDVGVEIVTTEEYSGGATSTRLLVNNPSETAVTDAHVFLEFINISGTVVSEVSTQVNLPPGPTTAAVSWDSAAFDPAFSPDEDYIVMAFLTDYQGNILDTAGRPLSSFQDDPRPAAALDNGAQVWDFGSAQQGTLLEHPFALASVGYLDLLAYLGNAPGLSVDGPAATSISPGDVALYTVQLNTESLGVGAYEATIPVRTSDPQNPAANLTIRGNITAMPADAPGGAVLRPLDVDAAIAGDHTAGEWVNFTHSLGPDAQSLQPVKVYSQDYGNLHGVGKYATDFGAGTASAEMFGDGRDGVMPGSGNLDNTNGFAAGSVNGTVGATSISVTDRYAIARVNPGDVVLIHQTRGSGAGQWELNKAVADFTGSGTFALEKSLKYSYVSNGGNEKAQILRVPQYSTCNVTGTVTPLAAWNGDWGGIFAVMCSVMNVTGSISLNGFGYKGGIGGTGNVSCTGYRGESYTRPSAVGCTPSEGGGGAGPDHNAGNYDAAGGGGGGNATSGTNGGNRGGGGTNPGYGPGGASYGVLDQSVTFMGSGGGGGGGRGGQGGSGGQGGGGGGILFIGAKQLIISGITQSNGNDGARGSYTGDGKGEGSGGGGAGGSVLLKVGSASIADNKIIALGGTGGPIAGYGGSGGNGGQGRIRIEYCDSLTGTTNPSASVQKLNCYIAEQVESTPYNTARLNLPQSFTGGRTYKVQYGRQVTVTSSSPVTTTIRLPKQLYSDAALDALVNNTGVASGAFNLSVDFGNNGTPDWSHNATTIFPATLNVTGTVSALNAYLVSRSDIAWGANVDVPVRVVSDRQADVMLTNLVLTPVEAKTRTVRLEARTYQTATLGLEFRQPGVSSGPLAFTVDVGADGSVDWSYAGTPSFPAQLTSPNLAAAVSSYLAGRSGEVDVPIRIVPSPFLAVSLTDFDADPADRPDLTSLAPSAGVARSGEPIVEGDTVPLTALIQNNGPADSGPLAVTFFATRNSQSFYIGTAFVPNVPRSGTEAASLQWNTLGFPGDVTVQVVVDPFNRTAEGNESNNTSSALIPIRTRPDLRVSAIALSNPLLMAGETVTVTLTLSNSGQTAAGNQTVALYNANPDSGGTPVGAQLIASVPGETNTTIQFQWTPTTPGPYRLFSLSDRDGAVNESDEGNNRTWQDVYVGLAAPVLLNSGPGESVYSSATGYGVVDEGQADVLIACGSGATTEETQRLDFDGRLVYRFDHLLPGRFYHLDVTLYECTGAGRQQSIFIDGNTVDGPINLGDGEVHHRSILIDPALYADHSVQVSIESPGVNGAIVSAVNLHAVDYRYADSGGTNDPAYSAGLGYGAVSGVPNSAWGRLPYQSVRVNQTGRSVDYRYDGLTPDKFYQLHLSFYQTGDTSRVQQVEIDGKVAGAEISLPNNQKQRISLPVPTGTYTDDGSISVSVVRVNADVGAIVNEIALEEVTVPTGVCGVAATPYWSYAYGNVTVEGAPALPGTVITAENPDGKVVGCYQVGQAGFYGFLPIFGANNPAPGMAEGQQVKFRVNGQLAVADPPLVWTNDKDIHPVNLTVSGIESQWIRLNPGWTLFSLRVQPPVTSVTDVLNPVKEVYCYIHGEEEVFDCNLPPLAQGLTELHGGKAYFIRNDSGATANLFVQGAPIPPIRPIPLRTDWNWVGYLLQESTPVAAALASIGGKYSRVADGKARLYNPALPQFSTLTQMVPDDGYLIFMTATATLIYPEPLVSAGTEPVAVREVCADVSPTPTFTWLYGGLLVNGQPAAVGSRVDVLTPRGELAGCFTVDSAGLYGFLPVYGADGGNPPLPGFIDGEPMTVRVNGQMVALAQPLLWRNDKQEHPIDLSVEVTERRFFLPLIGR